MKNIYFGNTINNGKGIFAANNIKAGELIFVVKGKIVEEGYPSIGKEHWFGIEPNFWIDASKDNPIIYTNHSCNPNIKIRNKVEIIAVRDINKDEELCFDYSLNEFDPFWQMVCNCETMLCRGIIVGRKQIENRSFKIKS